MEAELHRSNQELEQFSYIASHDLRQPLRTISGFLKIIETSLGPDLPDDMKPYFRFVIDGVNRMNRMILDLLDYSRVGRDQAITPLDVAEIVKDALLNLEGAIAESGAVVSLAPHFPTVQGRKSDLTRLFQNLIDNAIKYRHPDRALTIEIDWAFTDQDTVIWVKDNGTGIDSKDYDRAFMIFQRLVPKGTDEGTGIGLAVCKKIVERHGGRIWVESAPGQGCTFKMAFPLNP